MIMLLLHGQGIKDLIQDVTGQTVFLTLEITKGDVFGKEVSLCLPSSSYFFPNLKCVPM